ncbi:MAG: glycosyltransferase family 4 protein [Candidatus Electrothrix sp. Rat3]|nr:glycosyltransferase family 4 protein [Candidatus Electrothrix rattekaaiensis]
MKKVIHLIPYDGIGGVETAARSMAHYDQSEINFQINYIFSLLCTSRNRIALFNPLPFLKATRQILIDQPDILIVSLWRSCIVGLLVKMGYPAVRLVLFLHLPKDVHFPDWILTRLTAKLAHQVWADSEATLACRISGLPGTGKVISFVTHRLAAYKNKMVKPIFVFWGRIHSQKRLERSLTIFADIHTVYPKSHFIVIGPDGGELTRIREVAGSIGITNAVRFVGEKNFSEIKELAQNAFFYLQTSDLEGMAMSVLEAMQLGLVPVVTPVGEIASYCRHQENSLLITSDRQAVDDILGLLNNSRMYEQLRERAIATWTDKPLYSESVVQACLEICSEGGAC